MAASARTPAPADGPELPFDGDRSFDWRPAFHREVRLVPWGKDTPRGAFRAAGVFDRDGCLLPDGHCWRYRATPITVPPSPPEDDKLPERLQGRWMFGGLFYGHFGHFLVETTSRLWALDQLDDLQGIVFYPKQRLSHERRQFRHMLPFFDALGLANLQIRCPQLPVIIDELALPLPGFGMADMMRGRPEYRSFIRRRLGADIAPEGPEDIYISRARLPSKRGTVMHETRLEDLMRTAGYTVVHPQDMPLEEQIAHWKAARRIVALDGSALHLVAMVASPDARVALINRGPSNNIEDYVLQFRSFAGIDPLRIDSITGFYHPGGRRVVKRETQSLLDFRTTGAALKEGRFIKSDADWTAPSETEISAAVAAAEDRLGEPLQRHEL